MPMAIWAACGSGDSGSPGGADRGSAAEVEVDAVLARVAARLVLVAVVHHELQAIRAPADHLSRGDEGVDVPAHLGAVALVAQGRIGHGIALAEIPVVLGRIGIWRDCDRRRRPGLVDGPDGSLPRAEDCVGREGGAPGLPVPGLAGRVRGDVGDEERGEHRPIAQVRVSGARGRVGAGLVAVEGGRADLGIRDAATGGGGAAQRREWVVRDRGAGLRLHRHPPYAERERVLVVVPELDRQPRRRRDGARRAEGAEHLALVEDHAGARVAARERIHDRARGDGGGTAPGAGAAAAGVGGAGVAIVAGCRVVDVDAAGRGVAGVVGAEVAVVAVGRGRAHAPAAAAGGVGGAGVDVAAGRGVVGMHAARRLVAAVIRAGIPVVAARGGAPDAVPAAAGVVGGARVAVIAGRRVVGVDAAGGEVAAVVGAAVAVVAVRGRPAYAAAAAAGVVRGARVPVVAGGHGVGVPAAGGRAAVVVGADVAVVPAGRRSAHAVPAAAGVVGGAGVAVAAGQGVVGVHAAGRRVAAVVGADVAVVAVGGRAADAPAGAAGVVQRARVPVAAGRLVVGVGAARRRAAGVVGAVVAVVAAGGEPADALPAAAGVVGGAGVAVVAGHVVGGVDAAARRVAAVVGAGIAVVARDRGVDAARDRVAGVGRARVEVVAGVERAQRVVEQRRGEALRRAGVEEDPVEALEMDGRAGHVEAALEELRGVEHVVAVLVLGRPGRRHGVGVDRRAHGVADRGRFAVGPGDDWRRVELAVRAALPLEDVNRAHRPAVGERGDHQQVAVEVVAGGVRGA